MQRKSRHDTRIRNLSYLEKSDPLWTVLSEQVSDEGLLLYDAQKIGADELRVMIERPAGSSASANEIKREEESGSATSGDCTVVCRRLRVYFLSEGSRFGLHPELQIDVSSPGINRHLRLVEHFTAAVGSRVKVVSRGISLAGTGQDNLSSPETSTTAIGQLQEVRGSALLVEDEQSGKVLEIPLEAVKKARIDFKF